MKKAVLLSFIVIALIFLGWLLVCLLYPGYLVNPITNTLFIQNDRGMENAVSADDLQAFAGKVVFGRRITLIHGDWSKAKEIVIKNGVKGIGDKVFEESTADISVPASIEEIGFHALWDVEGVITTDQKQTHFLSLDGMFIDLDTKTLINISPWASEIEIPECVEHIGSFACAWKVNLKKVSMPYKVLTISFAAFSDCENLTDVQLSDSLLEIWEEAFYGCPISVLIFPPNVEFKSIEKQGMFYGTRGFVFSDDDAIIDSMNFRNRALKFMAFLDKPPKHLDMSLFKSDYTSNCYGDDVVIYYLNSNKQYWAPNGETEWNEIPIIGIDSLDDLPKYD